MYSPAGFNITNSAPAKPAPVAVSIDFLNLCPPVAITGGSGLVVEPSS